MMKIEKKTKPVPHTRALKRLMIERKTNKRTELLLHMCFICKREETEGDLFSFFLLLLLFISKYKNKERKREDFCHFLCSIRSSVVLVQLPMDYFVRLNVFLQLYNQMHKHVLLDSDVHCKMNFHI